MSFFTKEAGARAIFFAMKEAIKWGLSKAIFLSDALEVIQAINESCDWLIAIILHDIKGLTKYFESLAFYYISRSLNRIAHNFARKSLRDSPKIVLM